LNQIRPNLWIGDSSPAMAVNVGQLHAAGITAILNVAAEINDLAGRDFGLLICKAGLSEQAQGDQPRINAACALLDYLLSAGHKVFIHCAGGCNRSPYISALCLAKREGKSFDAVLDEIRAIRPCAANASTIMAVWYGKG
jgi:protein-tyrosine phosphatase